MHMSALFSRNALFAVALLLAAHSQAAIYAVGNDPGCTHATIQQAIWAAEASPEDDFIRIPHTGVWNDQVLVINDAGNVSFEGFWSDCNTLDDSQQTILDGSGDVFGGVEASILTISAPSGGTISLDFLTLRNGDPTGNDSKGGGIYYRGNGTLVISNGGLVNNTAGLGGGLYAEGTGSAATVQILGNVAITGNVAHDSGGGVFAEAVHFAMVQPNSIIAFNEATGYDLIGVTVGGYGGGLVVNDTDDLSGYATIGSAGVGNVGAIYGNTARYGGGAAVFSEGNSTAGANLHLYATQAGVPAKVEQNFASVGGGGLYVSSEYYGSAHLWNASIESNAAPEGSALFVENGGFIEFNRGDPPADAVPCVLDTPCARIANNIDQDALGQPTGGAVIHFDTDYVIPFCCGFVYDDEPTDGPRGTVLEGNRGGRLFDLAAAALDASHLLIANNELSQELIRGDGWTWLFLSDSTIAGNTIGGNTVLDFDDADDDFPFGLRRVLLWQPGMTSFAGNTTTYVESSIVSEAESLGGGPGAIVNDPRFIDPARADYRLRAASPAIDYAQAVTGDDRDAYGLPRDQRIGAVPRPEGIVRDIGAFERPTLLPLVLNGDFAGDANLWFLPVGHTGNYGAANAPGSPDGTGSAQVTGTNADGHLYGYAQCIHLPGPGVYALNASTLTSAVPEVSNPTALLWDLRADGGEGCIDGAVTTAGSHALASQTGGEWVRPTNPAYITVPTSMWNPNTSLTLVMAVYANASNNDYNGYFDFVTLEWSADSSDVIFQDGFDHL